MIYYAAAFLCASFAHIQTAECNAITKQLTEQKKLAQGEQKMKVTDDALDLNTIPMKKAIRYMMWAPSKVVVQKFEQMSLGSKCMLLKRMNIQQYGWFLLAFSEEQWSQMWQRLSEKEQRALPSTRLEQLKMVRDCWLACSGGDLLWYVEGSRDDLARDLPFYRNRALERLEMFKTNFLKRRDMKHKQAMFYQMLHNCFQVKKLQMLRLI